MPQPGKTIRHRSATGVFGTAWVACVIVGMGWLMRYQMTPGRAMGAQIPTDQSILHLAKDRPTLMMFVHPRCPCSEASMEELAQLMTLCKDRVAARVLFVNPSGQSEMWSRTSLWRDAEQIAGVDVRCDIDGMLANRLGIQTSGHVLLFDTDGKLLFSGGITGSRGHVGDNDALSTVEMLLREPQHPAFLPLISNVYGCDIPGATSCPPRRAEILR
jgi:hypothetical protein